MLTRQTEVRQDGIYRVRPVLKTGVRLGFAHMRKLEVGTSPALFRVRAVAQDGSLSPWAIQRSIVVIEPFNAIVGYRLCAVDSSGRRSPWVETAVATGASESQPGGDLLRAALAAAVSYRVQDDISDAVVSCALRSKRSVDAADAVSLAASLECDERVAALLQEAATCGVSREMVLEAVTAAIAEFANTYSAYLAWSDAATVRLAEDAAAAVMMGANLDEASLLYTYLIESLARAFMVDDIAARVRSALAVVLESADRIDAYITAAVESVVWASLSGVALETARSDAAYVKSADDHIEILTPLYREVFDLGAIEWPHPALMPHETLCENAAVTGVEDPRALPVQRALLSDFLNAAVSQRPHLWADANAEHSQADAVLDDDAVMALRAHVPGSARGFVMGDIWALLAGEHVSAYGAQRVDALAEEAIGLGLHAWACDETAMRSGDSPTAFPILAVEDVLFDASRILELACADPVFAQALVEAVALDCSLDMTVVVPLASVAEALGVDVAQGFGASAELSVPGDSAAFTDFTKVAADVLAVSKDAARGRVKDYNLSAYTGSDIGVAKSGFIMGRFVMGVTAMGE